MGDLAHMEVTVVFSLRSRNQNQTKTTKQKRLVDVRTDIAYNKGAWRSGLGALLFDSRSTI